MTERRPPSDDSGSDENLERLLAAALVTQTLDAAARERVRAAAEREWRIAAIDTRNRRGRVVRHRWYLGLGLAAGLAVLAVSLFVRAPTGDAQVLGRIARVLDGGVELSSWVVGHRALAVGDPVRVGDQLTAHGLVLLSLAQGGTLRVAAGTSIAIPEATQIALQRGLIYVDCPPDPKTCGALRVATSAGLIEHVGTEFEVLSDSQAVRIRVREGRIRFIGQSVTLMAAAGTELLAGPGERISTQPVATFGRDWLWTAALAPDYPIEGRRLIDFLQWASRELGRPLEFADAHAQQVANQTTLHGSIRGEDPLDALAQVLATTSLSYELTGGTIRVHSSP